VSCKVLSAMEVKQH